MTQFSHECLPYKTQFRPYSNRWRSPGVDLAISEVGPKCRLSDPERFGNAPN